MWRRIANATLVAARVTRSFVVNAQGFLVVMSKSLSLISIPLALGEQGNAIAWLLPWLVFCRFVCLIGAASSMIYCISFIKIYQVFQFLENADQTTVDMQIDGLCGNFLF